MTYDEATAAIGRRVRVSGGKYHDRRATILGVTRKLVELQMEPPGGAAWADLSPYRLTLVEEEETDV